MATPAPQPAATPALATPGCSYTGCTAAPLVQWQRRPTEAELEASVAIEQARRDQILSAADPEQPAPVFGPLPTQQDTTIAVLACGPHAISMDTAALVHAATCTAPNVTTLPVCNCTPEPAPPPEPMLAAALPLPDHWQ